MEPEKSARSCARRNEKDRTSLALVGRKEEPMNTNRIAEFESSDHALRFAKMLGADYTVCAGIRFPWAVRPKSRREIGMGHPEQPSDSYIDEDRNDE